ncbi:MAG: hypothetical protein BMS9Abin31_0164 [Gammaproteobacteria bacterium]|nr:MAG: hypothetical protein BMS9Abin31_0164 [Gammaproteobacteria bacterium]
MAKKKNRTLHPDEPLLHPDHPRPVTRREFIQQGFISGAGAVIAPSMLGMLASSPAQALSLDMQDLKTACGIVDGAGKIPFICFDLAGGANFAGSNVLVGGPGGIEDPLTTAGYSKLGIAGDMLPSFGGTEVNVDRMFGLPFHSDSAMLQGMKECFPAGTTTTDINGAVIPARSGNDTGNNPHNPMYAIQKAGASGDIMSLIGSQNTVSGGNSLSPALMIDLTVRPTKIDRQSDVLGLVDTGELANKMGVANATRVMEAIERISEAKLNNANIQTGLVTDAAIKNQVKCNYVQSAYMVERYGVPTTLDVDADTNIAAAFGTNAGIYATDRELRKTASVMKMVINGLAGAGTISMGGYDYHTGNRTTGEARDLRAGRCIGACLRYAELVGKPLMIYVFSDGSLASNGAVDPNNGKLVWTGDNSSTACSFFLVYDPTNGAPTLNGVDAADQMKHQQIGWFRPGASVETTNSTVMANNVNLLVESVVLNYMALHGEEGNFETLFPNHGLGNATKRDSVTAFGKITP